MKKWQLADMATTTSPGDWLRRAIQSVEIARWRARGCPFRTPHPYKQGLVREFGRRYGLRVFVETGTQHGRMLMAVQRHFKLIYSIELHPGLYEFSRHRLARFPHIHLIKGDSGREIPRVLESLEEDALFWLDAHFSPRGPSGELDNLCPLMAELAPILKQTQRKHVLLVDDVHSFTHDRGYPALEQVRDLVRQLRPDLNWTIEHDIIRITP